MIIKKKLKFQDQKSLIFYTDKTCFDTDQKLLNLICPIIGIVCHVMLLLVTSNVTQRSGPKTKSLLSVSSKNV